MLDELTGTQKVLIALISSGIVIALIVLMIFASQSGDKTNQTVRTQSGLEYVITQASDSDRVAVEGDVVNFFYTGKRASDGFEFDSNVGGTPVRTQLGQGRMIPGVEEALTGMREGEKRTATIPSDLGYGAAGNQDIPPNEDLIFELEMAEIE